MDEPRRQTGIAVMAGIVTALCLLAIVALVISGGWLLWLLIPTGLLALVCSYGVWESLGKVPRDSKGCRL